ncbi:hypothetical protein ACRE_053670 [Hapsidospora chrysogenum ATCC 11550]|uniref:Rrn9 domain-containing protein n=1 Tax=Hapsidospora chrysogenum (strain ATCC 11550 / CBS 779.69 / DSM 880 / IAM 14645 / JCM 23072 / IMI 49137) TaxID=857340 RepID=A0A086T3D0_HAPC1|nr:hypothetical protein ACRE_053670 [Hapsidospora chrysogenum ATCC 11550]
MDDNESPPNWAELDNDEIASIASEDLHEHRPNRWRGPKSTWLGLTEEERTVWQSMRRIDDRDLGVHLYNAFALKKRGRDPATAMDLTVQTADGRDIVWAPPKLWTAWPLAEDRLPVEDLVSRQDDGDDEDDQFTFRRSEIKMPSSDLQDELGATMLRLAKRRFLKRKRKWERTGEEAAAVRPSVEEHAGESGQASSAEEQEASPASSPPRSRTTSAAPSSGSGEEDMQGDDEDDAAGPSTPRKSHRRRTSKTYEPRVSTNDELSYELLRPSIRHILAQLDSTLEILHHTRAIGRRGYNSDSSASADEESDSQQSQRHRSSSIKRSHSQPSQGRTPNSEASDTEPQIKTEQGTDTEPKDQGNHNKNNNDADDDFEAWLRKGTRRGARAPGLRDWSDVLGAASLAGFPPDVIARTARRCANLFGEGMTIRTLHEVPAPSGTGVRTVDYLPEPIALSATDDGSNASDPSSDDDQSRDEEHEQTTLLHRRIASRQSSLAPPSRSSSLSSTRSLSLSRSRSRSRSRSASVGQQHFCPVSACPRAASGFSRRANLKRHMNLVHGGFVADDGSATEVDSEDEVLGAVHVDGFLRAVVPSRGWRGEGMATRKRRRFRWGAERGE